MELHLPRTNEKSITFAKVEQYLGTLSFHAISIDAERPWGGFFVIGQTQTAHFIEHYFPELPQQDIERGGRLSPKILVVEPGKRLSWQYHNRREELWKVITGPVGVITSMTNEQGPAREVAMGETVQFSTLVRHRLIGLQDWGVVAEIWQHTDPTNPSEESDIVRVSDDFGR